MEVEFECPFPADVHWFGAYLRNGSKRWSLHPTVHVPGGCFVAKGNDGGRGRFAFVGKVPRGGLDSIGFRGGFAANPQPPTVDAIRRLGETPHPRLLIKGRPDVFARIKAAAETNELVRLAVGHLKDIADATLETPPDVYRVDGRRMASREFQMKVFALSMMYRIYGERRYLERLERELRAFAAFPDWNPAHFLDTAMITSDFALAYDWLYDDWSDEMRELIVKSVVEKGLSEMKPDAFWIHNGNNWSQVNLAGLSLAAIAVAERVPELAQRVLADAILCYHEPMEAYAPNGSYAEGIGYWHYATLHNVLFIDALELAFGTDFGLFDEPGFRETAYFPALMLGPSGEYYGYSDYGFEHDVRAELWWFAKKLGDPALAYRYEAPNQRAHYLHFSGDRSGCHDCCLSLLWMLDLPEGAGRELPRNWSSQSEMPLSVQASGGVDGFWVGMKGGTARASHAHADQGSFVLDAFGVRWAEDPGGESYSLGESKYGMRFWDNEHNDSPRWSYFRIGPSGHNLVTIEGEEMNVVGYAAMTECAGPQDGSVVIDLSDIHPAARKATRKGTMLPGGSGYRFDEEYLGLEPGTELVWRLTTLAKPEIAGRTVRLTRKGKALDMTASDGEWSVFVPDMTGLRPADPGLVQLQLRVRSPSPDARWSVTFAPAEE